MLCCICNNVKRRTLPSRQRDPFLVRIKAVVYRWMIANITPSSNRHAEMPIIEYSHSSPIQIFTIETHTSASVSRTGFMSLTSVALDTEVAIRGRSLVVGRATTTVLVQCSPFSYSTWTMWASERANNQQLRNIISSITTTSKAFDQP